MSEHVFWADTVADDIEARDPTEPIVIKGGISPSGVPHLGNANEIVLGYFVAEVLRERGYEVRQIFTTDDRDPLRRLPRTLADLDGELVGLGDVDASVLGTNLGKPYSVIPDPFGCCDSYADHFTTLITAIASDLSIPVDVVSTTELYASGTFDETIRSLLRNRSAARAVLAEYQSTVDTEYIPFKPHCASCGKETRTITAVDADAGTVEYRCTDLAIGDQTISGCGHEGTATVREGKLPWRFEWVAQWKHLGVDFEPFGKDHAEGSWPSGVAIAETLLDTIPPVPYTYEWFTLDGEAFSSSSGHVLLVSDVLDFVEPAVLRYFFARDPSRSRDFSIERIDQLVDEFDRLEAIALDRIEPTNTTEGELAERLYPFLVDQIDPGRVRLPYRFAAVLGMSDDPDQWEAIARKEGHIPEDSTQEAVSVALERVSLARTWARHTDNEYNYELHRHSIPPVDIDETTATALATIADAVASTDDGEVIQRAIYDAARTHGLDIGELFAVGYQLFLNRPDGPQLGPFLASLDQEFVINRLRRKA